MIQDIYKKVESAISFYKDLGRPFKIMTGCAFAVFFIMIVSSAVLSIINNLFLENDPYVQFLVISIMRSGFAVVILSFSATLIAIYFSEIGN